MLRGVALVEQPVCVLVSTSEILPVPACVKMMVAEFELQGAINGLGVVIANEGAVA